MRRMGLQRQRAGVLRAIILGTLLAGSLDILDPIVFYGIRNHIKPQRILQSVASGLLGRASFTGGLRTALIGLALHFLIAAIWTTLFVLAAQRLRILSRYAIASGLLYGGLIYIVMNYVVIPLSHAGAASTQPIQLLNGVLAIVVLVGLSISLVNRRVAP
jgi:uncharacterized membrane protein YagU involved in acid resistance